MFPIIISVWSTGVQIWFTKKRSEKAFQTEKRLIYADEEEKSETKCSDDEFTDCNPKSLTPVTRNFLLARKNCRYLLQAQPHNDIDNLDVFHHYEWSKKRSLAEIFVIKAVKKMK